MLTVAGDDELARIQSEIIDFSEESAQLNLAAIEQLSPRDFVKYRSFLLANYFRLENLIAQHQLGLLDQETTTRAISAIRNSLPLWKAFKLPEPEHLKAQIKLLEEGS